MKKYRCITKLTILEKPCGHNCQVEAEFEPKNCLKSAMYQKWQEIDKCENLTDKSFKNLIKALDEWRSQLTQEELDEMFD